MLDHLLTLFGPSNIPPLELYIEHCAFVLHATSDTINVLDVATISVVRVLAFWEAFPGAFDGDGVLSHIAVDNEKKLILGTIGSQIAVWSCPTGDSSKWNAHSSMGCLSEILCLDCNSGLLVVGTSRGLTEYRLSDEGDIPSWSKTWSTRFIAPSLVRLSPSGSHLACASSADNNVVLYSSSTRQRIQIIRHTSTLDMMAWRPPGNETGNQSDLILYTRTLDGVVRIFLPVLDMPNVLQLHATVDAFGFMPDRISDSTGSRVFGLNRKAFRSGLAAALEKDATGNSNYQQKRPLLQQIVDENWDLFARILPDGSLVVLALVNVDRRPPTMLKQFTILHTPPNSIAYRSPHRPSLLNLFWTTRGGKSSLILLTSPPFRSYIVDVYSFFDGILDGLTPLHRSWDPPLPPTERFTNKHGSASKITRFERTPEGGAVLVRRQDGSREVWVRADTGRLRLVGRLTPGEHHGDTVVCVFNAGRTIALYSEESGSLIVKHFESESSSSAPIEPITQAIDVKTDSKPLLFSLPQQGTITPIACATLSETILVLVEITRPLEAGRASLKLTVHETQPLPLVARPQLIVPVDPMAWKPPRDHSHASLASHSADATRDVFVSVSMEGQLSFWATSTKGESPSDLNDTPGWKCTGRVHTGRRNIAMAECSSAKKTVLVVELLQGQEVTIWDSTESEFASGLEFKNVYSEPIQDLDWTSTYDSLSVLALGFAHKIVVLCPQRMSYFDERATWGVLRQIDMTYITPFQISDSIWLSEGSFLVGAGHEMFLYGEPQEPFLLSTSTPEDSLFESAARQNGPLDDFHPQMILQCLLWNKIDLVKEIIGLMGRNLLAVRSRKDVELEQLPLATFWEEDGFLSNVPHVRRSFYHSLSFGDPVDPAQDRAFDRDLVTQLTESLETYPLPHLTPSEMEHLIVLIHTTLEIEEQRRSLDANGVRYLISMRSFFIINRRVTDSAATPGSRGGTLAPFVRERIRYRDILWAFHSESQDVLLQASTTACGGKMYWLDARALGVFLWGNSIEPLKAQMEVIARNQYMAGDSRDPTACCLFYFALGKVKLVHGLWKQASWHKEQGLMLKFLSNDFSDPRWKTAALKNGFALLSKQRFEYAAAFFLLGGSLKDAVNVCLKQLQDFQLAVALARVVEGDDGEVLRDILLGHVLPRAFREGNRWLGSWGFWMLKRRDLAVRVLLTPLRELADEVDPALEDIGDPHYDDPSLAVLFAQLKSKSLQTVKGTSEISGQTEFNFVLQMARVLCRMGCHVLAVDLVRSWSFDRPILAVPYMPTNLRLDTVDSKLTDLTNRPPPSPTQSRTASLGRLPASPTLRKNFARLQRSSMIIDMELPSFPPTRPASPPNKEMLPLSTHDIENEAAVAPSLAPVEQPMGLGSLMKSAKKDVAVPEFDMSNFSF